MWSEQAMSSQATSHPDSLTPVDAPTSGTSPSWYKRVCADLSHALAPRPVTKGHNEAAYAVFIQSSYLWLPGDVSIFWLPVICYSILSRSSRIPTSLGITRELRFSNRRLTLPLPNGVGMRTSPSNESILGVCSEYHSTKLEVRGPISVPRTIGSVKTWRL